MGQDGPPRHRCADTWAPAVTPVADPRDGGTSPSVRRWLAAAVLLAVAATGCGHVPKVIVLEDPLSAQEHVALGVAYERKGELDLAAREYGRALAKEPASFRARVNLGNVRLAQKRYDAAREEYLKALDRVPGDAGATNNLAWAAIYAGNGLDDALRRLESAMKDPASRTPPLLDTLGVLLGELSRDAEAAGAFAEGERRCEAGDPACTPSVRSELREHADALRRRRGAPSGRPPLVK
jgi:tetratricopeptide (TPR) repeat protein